MSLKVSGSERSRMRWRALLVFVGVLIGSEEAPADPPPSWQEFEIVSSNGQYVAETKVSARGGEGPWDWSFLLSVYRKNDDSKTLVWACPYKYLGYPGGVLSDDGSAFAYLSWWYYRLQPVAVVIRGGQTVYMPGQSFGVDESKLKASVSSRRWLAEEETPYRFTKDEKGSQFLEVHAIDGQRFHVDLKTLSITAIGAVSRSSSVSSTNSPPSQPKP